MKMPRTDTRVFSVLECFAEHGAMDVDEAIEVMGNLSVKSNRSRMVRTLDDAVRLQYLCRRGDKYQLNKDVESYIFEVMEIKSKKPKRDLVESPYRNIWTKEIAGYTHSLYQNKRGYEGKYK